MPPLQPTQSVQSRELKQRVLTCLNKLSDRDTYSAAASELETIAKTLSGDNLTVYISSVSATDASDKSPVRKQCLKLITILSQHHGNALSPHLSKLLSAVIRRLRDSDSNVRAACITATSSIASHLTKPPFSLLVKPFLEALFTEQELHSQIGVAMCLAAAVDASPEPDVSVLRKLMPRLERLIKSESFKAKAALLTLIGSVIGVGEVLSQQMVKNLVPCLVELLSSKDWAPRNAAAEALAKLAIVERDVLSEFKSSCLKTFEAKRFDKVKAVRETMNQMLIAWKEIPDLSDEGSPPPRESYSSSKEIVRTSNSPLERKKPILPNKTSPSDNNITKKSAEQAIFRKLEHKKPVHSTPPEPYEDIIRIRHEQDLEKDDILTKAETRRALFKVGPSLDHSTNPRESEDLYAIRNQLVQIETQQSNLLDLLQRYIGRTESGMQTLERRVHGLEVSIDKISFDLAGLNNDSDRVKCCKLPGKSFFRSKMWKRNEGLRVENGDNRGYRFGGGSGIIVNPLAEITSDITGISEALSSRVV